MDNTLRVLHLAGFGLEVPDLQVAEEFYTAFGLNAGTDGDVVHLRTDPALKNAAPAEIVVVKGVGQKRLQHLSFAVLPEDIPRFEEHLHGMGVQTVTPPFGRLREGLWFQDPWGTWIEY